LSLKLSDTRVYEPQIRARLGTTAHFCEVVVLETNTLRQVLLDAGADANGVKKDTGNAAYTLIPKPRKKKRKEPKTTNPKP